jgi:hypothetical protein
MTAQSLKAEWRSGSGPRGNPSAGGGSLQQAVPEQPKPEGYVFGRPTLYQPEYCQRAIDFMGRAFGHGTRWWGCQKTRFTLDQPLPGLLPRRKHGPRGSRRSVRKAHNIEWWRDGCNLCSER